MYNTINITMSDENTNTQDTVTEQDLPQEVIIIVGCICGSIVVILTVVLIVLCVKRQKSKDNYEKQQETRMSPVLEPSPSPDPSDITKPPVRSGLDNPGLDQPDNSVVDMDRSQDGPFVTSASGRNPNVQQYDNRRSNMADNHGPQWNGHVHYDNHNNDQAHRHSNVPRESLPPSYPEAQHMEDHREAHKPKKVIYEVVV